MKTKEKKSIGIIGLKGLPAFGGAATVGQSLINELKEEYDFTVYSVASHTSYSGEMDGFYQKTFKASRMKKFNVFFYYLKSALYVLFKENHDLIHLHHIDGAFILLLLRLKYKVVLTSHARPQLAEKWSSFTKLFFSINERIAILLANEFVCVAKSLSKFYNDKYSRSFLHIPNGVNSNVVYDNVGCGKGYILFAAGRIIPLKGLHLLLEALHKIDYNGKLVVLGNLDQMPSYKKKILDLSIGLDVDFIGLVKEKKKVMGYLKNSKLFIFPSYSENMSMMLLEAASMHAPIICSDIPENKDVFSDEDVVFFKSNNVQDLSDKLNDFLCDPEGQKEKINSAVCKIESMYCWSNIARNYKKIYEKYGTPKGVNYENRDVQEAYPVRNHIARNYKNTYEKHGTKKRINYEDKDVHEAYPVQSHK